MKTILFALIMGLIYMAVRVVHILFIWRDLPSLKNWIEGFNRLNVSKLRMQELSLTLAVAMNVFIFLISVYWGVCFLIVQMLFGGIYLVIKRKHGGIR